MNQKEMAALLGISAAAVSKLVKRGMPVDSLERAKRWRKRHLEPSRIKGARFDPAAPAMSDDAAAVAEVERLAVLLLPKVADTGTYLDQEQTIEPLRRALRDLPEDAQPRMPPAMWRALLEYLVSDELLQAIGGAFAGPVTPLEIMELQHQRAPGAGWMMWDAWVPLDGAADRHGYAIEDPDFQDDYAMPD